jgi:hypothetical protein
MTYAWALDLIRLEVRWISWCPEVQTYRVFRTKDSCLKMGLVLRESFLELHFECATSDVALSCLLSLLRGNNLLAISLEDKVEVRVCGLFRLIRLFYRYNLMVNSPMVSLLLNITPSGNFET